MTFPKKIGIIIGLVIIVAFGAGYVVVRHVRSLAVAGSTSPSMLALARLQTGEFNTGTCVIKNGSCENKDSSGSVISYSHFWGFAIERTDDANKDGNLVFAVLDKRSAESEPTADVYWFPEKAPVRATDSTKGVGKITYGFIGGVPIKNGAQFYDIILNSEKKEIALEIFYPKSTSSESRIETVRWTMNNQGSWSLVLNPGF